MSNDSVQIHEPEEINEEVEKPMPRGSNKQSNKGPLRVVVDPGFGYVKAVANGQFFKFPADYRALDEPYSAKRTVPKRVIVSIGDYYVGFSPTPPVDINRGRWESAPATATVIAGGLAKVAESLGIHKEDYPEIEAHVLAPVNVAKYYRAKQDLWNEIQALLQGVRYIAYDGDAAVERELPPVRIADVTPQPLGSFYEILANEDMLRDIVVVVDIGYGTTDIIPFYRGEDGWEPDYDRFLQSNELSASILETSLSREYNKPKSWLHLVFYRSKKPVGLPTPRRTVGQAVDLLKSFLAEFRGMEESVTLALTGGGAMLLLKIAQRELSDALAPFETMFVPSIGANAMGYWRYITKRSG